MPPHLLHLHGLDCDEPEALLGGIGQVVRAAEDAILDLMQELLVAELANRVCEQPARGQNSAKRRRCFDRWQQSGMYTI